MALALGALRCGGAGGGAPAPIIQSAAATSLDYAGPSDATRWRLVKDPASTQAHVVLHLMAPPGASGMGVTLLLDVDGNRARWSTVGGALVAPGAYAGTRFEKVSLQGSQLRILLGQRDPMPPVAYGDAPVLTVALDLQPGARTGSAGLACSHAGHLGAATARPDAIQILVGALEAR
jgi:hypothetical protein